VQRLDDLSADDMVLRIGGNVLTPRGSEGFASASIGVITEFIKTVAKRSHQVVLLPGGAGGNVFIELARELGCADAVMNEVGCTLIDMTAIILADYLSRSLELDGIAACPKPASSIRDLKLLRRDYQVVVSSSSIPGATTTDSLSLLIGDAIECPVLSIKRNIPFADLPRVYGGDHHSLACVRISNIEKSIASIGLLERSGWHPSLDAWSLRLLRRPTVHLYFTTLEGMQTYVETGLIDPLMKVVRDA
jgi:uridylate kinase